MTNENEGKVVNLKNFKIKKKWKNLIALYDKFISFFKIKKRKCAMKFKNKNTSK